MLLAEAEDVSLSNVHRKITLKKWINFTCTFKQICAVVQEIQVEALLESLITIYI